jgi:uncharacterized phage protein (TIGR01671 family)
MRKIKFRGITEDGRIVYGGFSIHATEGKIVQTENELALTGKVVEYLQYTGLKDKNGKDIYEGDIVLYDDEHKEKHVISFGDGKFGIKLRGEFWSFNVRYIDEYEVIGNIHENPELLKG